ncbi:MAG TPA: hypothetical protein VHJ78_04315 [Actinomycetota bacterium]|nr:hypothetical protein [Actinomycetota bacterium]
MTVNDTRDFGIGKRLENLPALQVGFAANRRTDRRLAGGDLSDLHALGPPEGTAGWTDRAPDGGGAVSTYLTMHP